MELLSRLKRLAGFVRLSYEPTANTVRITLRLNTYFLLGAVIATVFFTLVFKYGGISVGSVLEFLSDLWRYGLWLWIGMAAVFAVLAVSSMSRTEAGTASVDTGRWSALKRRLPQGPRGTAVLCLALLAALMLVMWAASGDTATEPSARAQGTLQQPESGAKGLETPSLWRELQKGQRP